MKWEWTDKPRHLSCGLLSVAKQLSVARLLSVAKPYVSLARSLFLSLFLSLSLSLSLPLSLSLSLSAGLIRVSLSLWSR